MDAEPTGQPTLSPSKTQQPTSMYQSSHPSSTTTYTASPLLNIYQSNLYCGITLAIVVAGIILMIHTNRLNRHRKLDRKIRAIMKKEKAFANIRSSYQPLTVPQRPLSQPHQFDPTFPRNRSDNPNTARPTTVNNSRNISESKNYADQASELTISEIHFRPNSPSALTSTTTRKKPHAAKSSKP